MRKGESSQVNEIENESSALLNTQRHFVRACGEIYKKNKN
jgi:hypothetical protein